MEGPTSDYTRRFQVAKRAHGTKKLTPLLRWTLHGCLVVYCLACWIINREVGVQNHTIADIWFNIHSFIHCRLICSSSLSGTTQKRSRFLLCLANQLS